MEVIVVLISEINVLFYALRDDDLLHLKEEI